MVDEQVPFLVGGAWVTVGTVNGANQQGSSIITSGWGLVPRTCSRRIVSRSPAFTR